MDASDAETAFWVAEADEATRMTDLDRLREALAYFDDKKVLRDLGAVDVVCAAARRFLALTETGPDYDRELLADTLDDFLWEKFDVTARPETLDAMVDQILANLVPRSDALADYLTEDTG